MHAKVFPHTLIQASRYFIREGVWNKDELFFEVEIVDSCTRKFESHFDE